MSVCTVLIIKVLVKNMIDPVYYKSQHTINYFNLALKCPLLVTHSGDTHLVYNQDILPYTVVFQDTIVLYESNVNTIAAYLLYKIIKNCLVTKDDINTYESYFFNSIRGFCEINKKDSDLFDPSLVGKYWVMLLDIYEKILKLTLNPNVKKIDILSTEVFKPFVHLNISEIKPFSYRISPLIKLTFIDDTFSFIDIFPYFNSYLSIYHLALAHEFKHKLTSVYGFYLSMNSPAYSFRNINITDNYLSFSKIYSSYKVDFKVPSVFNCSSCIFRNNCDYFKTNDIKNNTPTLYMKRLKKVL